MKSLRGFSLVELVVALLLSGLLMAGMAKVFSTSISNFYRTSELMGAQRRNRWILNEFGDDLRMAGHTDGILWSKVTPELPEDPLMIIPGNNGAGSDRDQIDLFMNEPVQELTLSGTFEINSPLISLSAPGGGSLNIQAGDLLILKNGIIAENAYARAAPLGGNGPISFMDSAAQLMDSSINDYMQYGVDGALANRHTDGEPVTVLRPCQLIHYGIEDRALDPAAPATTVPCLVRKSAKFGSGVQGNWGTIAGEVVAENVSALRLELSVDGGVNWEHGATWADTVASANSRLGASNQISSRSFWFKSVPALIKVEIRSRTPVARTEYSNTPNTVAFRERTQVLVIAPRNFASPLG